MASIDWPQDRPATYDPDEVWDETNDQWSSDEALLKAGGGRLKNQIVVVGHKKIYFGEV